MLNCIAVGAGGFVGAVLRYLVSMIPLDKTGAFPVNTLLINILGAFAIGAITAFRREDCGA
ncbi:MAG: CrcB family protein [Oscillospiraceae bacterium]